MVECPRLRAHTHHLRAAGEMMVCAQRGALRPSTGQRQSLERADGNSSGRLDEPALALERLPLSRATSQSHQGRGEWTQIGRGNITQRVPAVGVDHQPARTGHGADHSLGVLERLSSSASGPHQVGIADFLGMAFHVNVLTEASNAPSSV